ncbi:MAG: hypothetical protein AB1715_14360, partial [Acidobacteriota bacterium]
GKYLGFQAVKKYVGQERGRIEVLLADKNVVMSLEIGEVKIPVWTFIDHALDVTPAVPEPRGQAWKGDLNMIKLRLFRLFSLALFLVAAAAAGSASERPNFSGQWVFNAAKSKLELKVQLEAATFSIDHKDTDFHFSRVFIVGGQESTHSYVLATGGREKVEEQPDRTLHSRLYWDGDVLVYDVRIVLKDGREATNIVRYSLRDEGRTFVAEEKFRGPVLKYDNLWVADRKI